MRFLKRFLLALLIGFVLNDANMFGGALSIKYDEWAFRKNADLFGNKTANLQELGLVSKELNGLVKPVEGQKQRFDVPPFFGISNDEVRSFLEEKGVLDFIKEQWGLFKELQPQGAKKLVDEAKGPLAKIREAVQGAFKENSFFISDKGRSKTLEAFLSDAKSRELLLMVRSTGREDSKELANAGGNESVSSVPPELLAISKSMGEVVASYFSEKSIGQRILGGDAQLFADPFMPVLFQFMVGERPGKKDQVPVSGVMFSQEAEGRTPGVVHIQATFGHNEGVVNGLVPVDSFYVGPSGIIHPLVRKKEVRLATVGDKLVLVPNERSLHRRPCLFAREINDLAIAAREIEGYYGYPVDIEFVVQGGVIYLVQVRPITWRDVQPSYIKQEYIDSLSMENKQPAYVIGAGGGVVQVIQSKDEIIVVDTLRQALKIFLDVEDPGKIKTVIVSELVPATSHEATTFRGAGKPVFYLRDLGPVKDWITSGNFPLLVDPQRGMVVRFQGVEGFKLPDVAIEKNAWLEHPIAGKVSLVLGVDIRSDFLEVKMQEHMKDVSTTGLVEIIRRGSDRENVVNALRSLLYRLMMFMVKEKSRQETLKKEGRETNPELVRQLEIVFFYVRQSVAEIYNSMDAWFKSKRTPADRISWLYPITFLEALIKQVPMSREFVDDYSLGSLIKIERGEEEIVTAFGLTKEKLRSVIAQYAKALPYAFTEEVQGEWRNYLSGLAKIDDLELQVSFANLMQDIKSLGFLPIWMNLSFPEALGKTKEPMAVTRLLVNGYEVSKDILKQMKEFQSKLEGLPISQWEKPELFEKQWRAFNEGILNFFLSKEFIGNLETAPQLARFSILMTMNKLVEIFDTIIKTVEASREYGGNVKQKAERFKKMLEKYFELLQVWATLPTVSKDMYALLDDKTFKSLDEYLKIIKDLLGVFVPSADVSQFQPSRAFNVSGAALGSKSKWASSVSGTETLSLNQIVSETKSGKLLALEDIFTLIHQNLLVVISIFLKNADIKEMRLPKLFSLLDGALSGRSYTVPVFNPVERATKNIEFFGVNFKDDLLIYFFNLSLRNHGNTFQIIYDVHKEEVRIKFELLGLAYDRWRMTFNLTHLFAELFNIDFYQEPKIEEDRGFVTSTLVVKNELQISLILKIIDKLIKLSFTLGIEHALNVFKELESTFFPDNNEEYIKEVLSSTAFIFSNKPNFVMVLDHFVSEVIFYKDKINDFHVILNEALKVALENVRSEELEVIKIVINVFTALLNIDFERKNVIFESVQSILGNKKIMQEMKSSSENWKLKRSFWGILKQAVESNFLLSREAINNLFELMHLYALDIILTLIEKGVIVDQVRLRAVWDTIINNRGLFRDKLKKMFFRFFNTNALKLTEADKEKIVNKFMVEYEELFEFEEEKAMEFKDKFFKGIKNSKYLGEFRERIESKIQELESS